MRHTLHILIALVLAVPFAAKAQPIDGYPNDSTYVHFNAGLMSGYIADTASSPLWQIGHSRKDFFGIDTQASTVILTDSINHYPINANNSFTIKIKASFNLIVDFWHKYQTDSAHDGGIVEFSLDHGATWQNIKGDCNVDSVSFGHGVRTSGFYTFADTLQTGEPAFTGSKNETQYSRLQFFYGIPIKSTHSGGGCTFSVDTFYVRFRFSSDATADTFAGWQIDSIKIENDRYEGAVGKIAQTHSLSVFPNPSINGHFILPALEDQELYTIEVYNALGMRVVQQPYGNKLDLSGYAKGLYFYKVSGGEEYYSGQLLRE